MPAAHPPYVLPEGTLVVAVCGLQESGKSTVGARLQSKWGFEPVAFAAKVKEACRVAFGWDLRHTDGELKEVQDERYVFTGVSPQTGLPLEVHNRTVGAADYWYDPETDEYYPYYLTPRVGMRVMGTEFGQRMCKTMWVQRTWEHIRNRGPGRYVVTDLRFEHELDAMAQVGGKTLRLLRGELKSNHKSELEIYRIPLEKFDVVLDNRETSLADLDGMVDHTIERLLTGSGSGVQARAS